MDLSTLKVYLAGPIFGKSNTECLDWRRKATELLAPHRTEDPTQRDFRGNETGNEVEIVEEDKAAIKRCDLVIAYCPEPSFGTAMEILFAWERGVPVLAVSESKSPWLAYHATATAPTVEAAVGRVHELAKLEVWTPAALREATRQNFPSCAPASDTL